MPMYSGHFLGTLAALRSENMSGPSIRLHAMTMLKSACRNIAQADTVNTECAAGEAWNTGHRGCEHVGDLPQTLGGRPRRAAG